MISPGDSKEIIIVEDLVKPVETAIKRFEKNGEITTIAEMEIATETLSIINGVAKQLDKDKKKLTDPLNELRGEILGRFKPAESALKGWIDMFRTQMSIYQTRLDQESSAETKKIAARVGDGKGHLTVETAVRKIGEIEKPAEKIASVAGSVTFRKDRVLKVTNEDKVWNHAALTKNKDSYFMINFDRLLEDLKAGKIVPGAEIEIISIPINRRS